MKIKLKRLPKNWDERPKGCWTSHPMTGEICQLPAKPHPVHMRKHPDGKHLECWQDFKQSGHLEDLDFRNLDPLEMIEHLRSFGTRYLEPLIRLVARGHAYDKSNYMARIAIADGEREAEALIAKEGKS
jgi:hypothetical protein